MTGRARLTRLSSRLAAVVVAAALMGAAAPAAASVEQHAPLATPVPGPPDAPEWWINAWHAPALWAEGADGRGITIAEIDSGVNASLPEFAGKILSGTDYGASGGNGHVDREVDPFGHGTAMASIMVASPGPFGIEGLAPRAKILPVAIPLVGTEDATNNDHLAQAIRWSADHGANIINMSLGAFRSPASDPLACPADEQAAILYALSKGALLVAAAGNAGPSSDPIEEPGVCLGVVTVGAIDASGQVASFSSRQPYLTVTAPGVSIPSLGRIAGQAFTGEGTSQSTALTSAALALIWSKYRDLPASEVLSKLLATLDHPRTQQDPAYGFGQINPYRAITATATVTTDNPVFNAVGPFLAQLNASTSNLPRPPPAVALVARVPGTYAANGSPSSFTGTVRVATIVALAGLLGLVLLISAEVRGRRRRAAVASPAPDTVVDGWRDVFPPPDWTAGSGGTSEGEQPGLSR